MRELYRINDSHSWIEPYSQRDHAWNHDQLQSSNFKTFVDDKPVGYDSNMQWPNVDPMNVPFDSDKYPFYGRYANGTLYNFKDHFTPYQNYYKNLTKEQFDAIKRETDAMNNGTKD